MRRYGENKEAGLKEAVCNKCGRNFRIEKEIVREEICSINIGFGYFSDKDGQIHQFDLCEDCYDELVNSFAVPVDIIDKKELF